MVSTSLSVRTTLESARTHLLHWSHTPDADELAEGRVEQVVLLARNFDQKLAQLEEALEDERDAWPEVRAILVDLVNGGTGLGLCTQGLGGCTTGVFAGTELLIILTSVIALLAALIAGSVRLLRWLGKRRQSVSL